ncbi:MAG: hypothetical protein JNL90_19250 [Planctomycetes bacterium]|nr:hypothetical protein [Planctomycetota bacterium]
MRTPLVRLPLLLAALLPIACPSGSSSGGPATVGALQAGRLIEPLVGGLPYSTPTHSGVTAADGTFHYRAGEQVTFKLGGTPIGRPTRGAAELSVIALVPGATLPVKVAELARFRQEGAMAQPAPDLLDAFEAVNVLVLLDALDADKESANGVTLAPNLDTVLGGTALDLRQASLRFQRGFPLRAAVYRAFDAGRILDARIRDPWPVLDRIFASMGVEPQAWLTTHSEVDWDNDGNLDSWSDTLLDSRGIPDLIRWDFDADGSYDTASHWLVDDDGRLLATEYDDDGDGGVDSSNLFTFDLHGRLERSEYDSDGDFIADRVVSYRYDAVGNLVGLDTDRTGDGSIDESEERQYDAGGRLVLVVRDEDGDGTPESTTASKHDANGFVIETSEDEDGDGTPDFVRRFENDAFGNPWVEAIDFDGDGDDDSVRRLAWDGAGNLVLERYDYNVDNDDDLIVTREYDELHRVRRYAQDNGADGSIEDTASFQYVDDVEGREVERRDDYGDDGTTNYSYRQTWGADGQRLATIWDVNGDGITDSYANEVQTRTSLLALTVGD